MLKICFRYLAFVTSAIVYEQTVEVIDMHSASWFPIQKDLIGQVSPYRSDISLQESLYISTTQLSLAYTVALNATDHFD
jgi:hypothetical protein